MNSEGKMSAPESSSSSSSSSESSAPSSPEAPKKINQSSSGATEASKKASNSSLEKHKESNTTRPSQRVSKSPSSSPEVKGKVPKLPAKGRKQPDTSVKSHEASKSPSSSPEASAEVPKSQKVSKSPSSSPEAPAKVPKLPPKGRNESATTSKSHKVSRSPSSSPEASEKVPKSPPEELKDAKSSEPPKKLSSSASKTREPPMILPKSLKSTQKSQPPRSHEDSGKDIPHPKESSEVQKASASPLGPAAALMKPPHRQSFKSSLQVMLKRQEQELEKSIEYREKLECGELDEDEDEGVGTKEAVGGKGERRGSEGNLADEKGKEKQEDADERVTKGEQEKEKSKKGKSKEDEDMDGKTKEKEEKKAQEEKKMERRKKEAEMEERTKKEEKQMKRKEEEEKDRERQMKRKDKEEEVEKRRQEGEMRKAEAEREEEKKKEERKESVKAMKSAAKEEKFHGSLYMKRKRTFNPWKEYYFVLDGLLLTYYSSKQQYDDLSGMKGSLDLTLAEEVQSRKPGFMKTHHPFCLTRRNLSSINLAAGTKEDRHRWLETLSAAIRPHRISSHSSDRTLHTTASASHAAPAAEPTNKASTLPARVKGLNSYASSVSEEEEEEEEVKKVKEKKEEEEEVKKEEEEEEEPELIKPKKILKVPIGLPLGMVNLGEVKLKKLEKKVVKEENCKTTSTAATAAPPAAAAPAPAAAAAAADATHNTAQDDPQETSPPGELFGVVLKKTRKPEEKEKEAPKDTAPTHPIPAKRPSKQPVIPLNSGKLLVVPTAKSPKTSPATQKRQTSERRKSPSPSLPISKSVQALTKSAEEVKETQVNVASSDPPAAASTTSAAAGRDKSGIKLCHAQTMEVMYNNVEVMEEAEEVVEVKAAKREEEETEKQDVAKVVGVGVESQRKGEEAEVQEAGKDAQEEKEIREDAEVEGDEPYHEEDEEAAAKTRPQDPIVGAEDEDAVRGASKGTQEQLDKELQDMRDKKTVSEAPAEDQSREDNSEGASSPPPEAPSVPSPLTPPASPASSQASAASGRSSPPSSPAAPPSKSSSSSTKSSLSSPKSIPSSLKSSLLKKEEEEEEKGSVEAWPLEVGRPRADTGESTASSTAEGGEKKPGKLRRLKKKLKSSASFKKEKEEPASPKEPRKRRGSNSLTALLAGKKKGGKKHAEEPQPHASQGGATSHTVTAAPHQTVMASSEPPPTEAPLPPDQGLPRVNLPEAHPNPPQRAEDSALAQMDSALAQMDSVLAQMDRSLGGQPSVVDPAAPCLMSSPGGEASPDTHSHLSVDTGSDQPPSIPKKTRMRAKSPNHDVPKSNRPVTNIQLVGMDHEDEPSQTVDGYITEEQIEALLMAKENENKRKQSKGRTQMLLSVPDAEKGASLPAATSSPSTEEWGPRRPAFNSFSSIESEESMPATNFLGTHRGSSSSGSLRGGRRSLEADGDEHTSLTASESGESLSPEAESPMEHQWRAPRPTDAITAKNRLSLTSPEFTVQEEEGLSSPETAKARPPCSGDDDKDKRKQENDDDKVEAGPEAEAKEEEEADSEAEQENFFPVVGGDVQLRHPPAHLAAALDLHKGELRTSGIVSLKEYLKTQEEDLDKVKSGISRLGHSAAVEKLKQASNEQ
ncbi:titin-like isoform X3 [Eriocheir sinensis]|uniref:titin-like isoform X3 n=1 Tax=Eriocheir sinensis TaxID=95602 RepID=UPI0021C93DED|nr:titin-like isoform X3 [Eriocheir sinensis]